MEIERKWMVTGWPEGLPMEEEFAMRQGYISVRPTVRIREEALAGGRTDYVLCFKSEGGLAREEIERSIDKELFEELEHKIIGKPLIPKTRRTYRLPDGSALEVNHVDAGRPTAFWYAEVEYPTVAAALPKTGVNWFTALAMALSGMALTVAGAFTSLFAKSKH